MALFRFRIRYLAHAVLALALLPGCSQSLFISPGGDGDGGVDRPDAREDTPPDGGMTLVDGGAPGDLDGGGRTDAGMPSQCPAPCAGDAHGDFDFRQGGKTGQWRYVEIVPEAAEEPFSDMAETFLPGAVLGWIGTGAEEPTIALCVAVETSPPCLELQGWLVLTSPGNAPDAHQPALHWTAEEPGFYRVSGALVVSSQAPEVATQWQISRNGVTEIILTDSTQLSTEPSMFMREVELQADDRLVLSVSGTSAEDVSVGTSFFITGPLNP